MILPFVLFWLNPLISETWYEMERLIFLVINETIYHLFNAVILFWIFVFGTHELSVFLGTDAHIYSVLAQNNQML